MASVPRSGVRPGNPAERRVSVLPAPNKRNHVARPDAGTRTSKQEGVQCTPCLLESVSGEFTATGVRPRPQTIGKAQAHQASATVRRASHWGRCLIATLWETCVCDSISWGSSSSVMSSEARRSRDIWSRRRRTVQSRPDPSTALGMTESPRTVVTHKPAGCD